MEKIFKTLLIVLLAISAVLVLWGVFATPDKPATAAEAPAIVVIASVVASGHDYQIVDLQNSAYFGRSETVLTDTSILITYVAMAGAVIAAIYSAVADSLK